MEFEVSSLLNYIRNCTTKEKMTKQNVIVLLVAAFNSELTEYLIHDKARDEKHWPGKSNRIALASQLKHLSI